MSSETVDLLPIGGRGGGVEGLFLNASAIR